jgi:hypothetical protein
MSGEGEERVDTECARPPADYEPTPGKIASPLKEQSPDLQQVHDGSTDDPEAPPWNFLFLLPIALDDRFP